MFRIRPKPICLDRDSRWRMWIQQIAKGDIAALESFYDESSPVVFSLVLQMLPDRELAEDVLLEIYNTARNEAHTFDGKAPLDWLITIGRDTAAHRLRVMMPSEPARPGHDLFKDERNRANLVLAQLPEEQRSILEMTYLGGLTADEAADCLQVSREYVSKQILFGARTLRMILAQFTAKPASTRPVRFGRLAAIRKLHA